MFFFCLFDVGHAIFVFRIEIVLPEEECKKFKNITIPPPVRIRICLEFLIIADIHLHNIIYKIIYSINF